jgi:hypothetical protein
LSHTYHDKIGLFYHEARPLSTDLFSQVSLAIAVATSDRAHGRNWEHRHVPHEYVSGHVGLRLGGEERMTIALDRARRVGANPDTESDSMSG